MTEEIKLELPPLEDWLESTISFAQGKYVKAQREGDLVAEDAWHGHLTAYRNVQAYMNALKNPITKIIFHDA